MNLIFLVPIRTSPGTSLAQAEVHSDTMNDIEKADRIFVRRFLNTELKPRLEKRGYPVAGGWFNFAEQGETAEDKLKRLDVAERVHNITTDGVDDDYFYEEFGLPRGKGKAPSNTSDGDNFGDDENEDPEDNTEENTEKSKEQANTKTKRRKLSVKNLTFFERMMDFFDHAPR